ncbi:MAG TPA: prepilin-type N-terminal cleavage/methylation domain-containing protein [Candidatus Companilactobacillus pullicola]|uniref:Prepilin-type N-terminal cleavage/methylation domain-containing protein n=2 Tax=Companilactobacillus TaxID=2767879 RepID=A0A9D1ZM94_9LACO|nr:prepilin-type N-terminal cleavage/methylation domain-containing protein [Candidatus Companilactobacillus pullicola]
MNKIRKGFTLIEMVIVLFIISLLLLIMIPNLTKQRDNANEKSNEALQTTIINQAELYSENHSDDDVTIDNLKKDNYISEKQVKRLSNLNLQKDKDTGEWTLVKEASH